MTTLSALSPLVRSFRAAVWVVCLCVVCHASVAQTPVADVVAIEPTRIADLVLLRGGFNAGLRQGMVCRLTRGGAEIAEVLLVDLRLAHSAALILRVSPQQSIRPGDLASIKILKT